MTRSELRGRLIGEFVVIVLGVLVALAVDDWNQERSDRELEINLLDRMQSEVLADGADLASGRPLAGRDQPARAGKDLPGDVAG
jgi:hypothetical protein